MVGIIGGIRQHHVRAVIGQQGGGLWGVTALSGGNEDANRAAEAADGHMDLAAEAAAGAANGLIFKSFFAPAGCWWARTMVLSMIRYSKSGSSAMAAKMRCHTPLALHRLKRRKTLFQLPNPSGRSRQGAPVRTIQRTASTNSRLSRPELPRVRWSPMMCGAIRAHASSFRIRRSNIPIATSKRQL